MDIDEYLVARIDNIKFGVYCRDVLNVYAQPVTLAKLSTKNSFFRGVAKINDTFMQVIDLRRRIGLEDAETKEQLTLISFQTDMSHTIAVVVDEIVGMKRIATEQLQRPKMNACTSRQNINLLFPMIALMDNGDMIYLLDSTYIEKTEPVLEEAGDLEFF